MLCLQLVCASTKSPKGLCHFLNAFSKSHWRRNKGINSSMCYVMFATCQCFHKNSDRAMLLFECIF